MKFQGPFFLLTWPEEISNNEPGNLVKMLKASKACGSNLIRLSANFITWLRISPTQTYQRESGTVQGRIILWSVSQEPPPPREKNKDTLWFRHSLDIEMFKFSFSLILVYSVILNCTFQSSLLILKVLHAFIGL